MIPKTIHYIWLGENEPNEHVKKCMQSWCILQDSGWNIKKWDDHSLQQLNMPKVVLAALENDPLSICSADADKRPCEYLVCVLCPPGRN